MVAREAVGQVFLEGIGEAPKLDMTHRQTFAGVARPEYWGLDPRSLTEVDYKDMTLVTPERLLTSLVGIPLGKPSSVAYQEARSGRLVNVALCPLEYGLVAGSVKQLGERAVNRTLASRPQRPDFGLDVAAADRSGAHTLEGYAERIAKYTTNTLEADMKLLDHMAEYIAHPGLNRLRGDNFRMNIEWFRNHIVGDTMLALRRQRDWTPEQEQRARKALDSRLFMDRTDNQHLKNWAGTVGFLQTYWGHKWALFKTKENEARRYTQKHG